MGCSSSNISTKETGRRILLDSNISNNPNSNPNHSYNINTTKLVDCTDLLQKEEMTGNISISMNYLENFYELLRIRRNL